MKRVLIFILFGMLSTASIGQNVILSTSNLPIVIIDTQGTEIPNEPKIKAYMGIIHNEGTVNSIDDPFNEYDGWVGIEVRGNGTLGLEKRSYLFETRNDDDSNNNVELLGLPQENDWILYAPFIDKSLMRNVMTYDIANQMGIYSSRTKFCELLLDGEYKGVYILMEKIKRDANRVNVTKFPAESTDPKEGGYILRIDSWFDEILGWTSETFIVNGKERTVNYQYVYPKYDKITDEQKDFIKEVFDDFEADLNAASPPDIANAFLEHIDLNSFVDYLLLNEFGKNPDAYRLSTYFHYDPTDPEPKIIMGPFWDHNHCYGSYAVYENKYTKWEFDNHWWPFEGHIPFWWEKFMDDSLFVKTFKDRWDMHKVDLLNCERLAERIDAWGLELVDAQERNYTRWPIIGIDEPFDWNAGPTYADELDYLKNWICNRIEWMDKEIKKLNQSFRQGFLNINPNPSDGRIDISFRADMVGDRLIEVFDFRGVKVETKSIECKRGYNVVSLELHNLNTGLHVLHMVNGSEMLVEKLMIVR